MESTNAKESEREVIEFGRGDVLLFRGDFIHSGADYNDDNFRAHLKEGHPEFPFKLT